MKAILHINPQGSTPFLEQIKGQLRAGIRQGRLRPGQRLPSVRNLSQEIGVSAGIVQQAITTLVHENYLRSHHGRGVFVSETRLRSQTITLVLPTCELEQMPRFVRGVKRELQGKTANLVVVAGDHDFSEELDLIRQLDQPSAGGAVIYPPPLPDLGEVLQELTRRGLPYVLVDQPPSGFAANAVVCDWHEVGRLALAPLLARGHRHIGIVGKDLRAKSYTQRLAGLETALAACGLRRDQLPEANVSALDLNLAEPWRNGQRAAAALLAAHPELTALVGMDEYLSLGAYKAAAAVGHRVGVDFSVLAVGDLEAFAMLPGSVTAVQIPHEEMARQATALLLDLIAGTRTGTTEVVIPPLLVERASIVTLTMSAIS